MTGSALLPSLGNIATVDTSPAMARVSVGEEFKAALFTTGGSQAVRLPVSCRFAGTHVRVRKEGNCVILEPIDKPKWPPGFWRWFDRAGPVSKDFVVPEALPPAPHRDRALDRFNNDAE
jgi:antitoxin VapB